MIVRSRHLFGLKRLDATFEPEGASVRMRVSGEIAAPRDASYLIYSETTQRFIGWRRGPTYYLDGSETSRRMRLVFYPAGRA